MKSNPKMLRVTMKAYLCYRHTLLRIVHVFHSIKEINRLRNEINRLLSKGMSNIYSKVTI